MQILNEESLKDLFYRHYAELCQFALGYLGSKDESEDVVQQVIADLTQEKLASHLFDSLRNKIMPLSDDLIVYPGHGAGSACGKNMSKETTDTLGNQKKTNYALNPALSREEFIAQVLDGLMPPPGYFPQNVLMNIQGYESIDRVLEKRYSGLKCTSF